MHPSNCHQGCIKGADLQQSQLWPASAPPLSVFSTVVSASALIIDVSPCIRQTLLERGGVQGCRGGGGANRHPLTVGLNLQRRNSRAEISGQISA